MEMKKLFVQNVESIDLQRGIFKIWATTMEANQKIGKCINFIEKKWVYSQTQVRMTILILFWGCLQDK